MVGFGVRLDWKHERAQPHTMEGGSTSNASRVDLSKTVITLDNDGNTKESFYVPILDDNSDQDFEQVIRPKTRSQTRAANKRSIFIDLSVDDEEAPVNQIRQGVGAIDIQGSSEGIFIQHPFYHSHLFLVEPSTQEDEEGSQEMNVDFKEAVHHDLVRLRDYGANSRARIIQTENQVTQLQMQVDQQQQQIILLQQQIAALQPQPQHQPQFDPEYDNDDNDGDNKDEAQPRQYRIAVSGQFAKQHRDLARLIESRGFVYLETVTVDCSFLIVSDLTLTNQKVTHAKTYGVPIQSGGFLADLLGVNVNEIVLNQ